MKSKLGGSLICLDELRASRGSKHLVQLATQETGPIDWTRARGEVRTMFGREDVEQSSFSVTVCAQVGHEALQCSTISRTRVLSHVGDAPGARFGINLRPVFSLELLTAYKELTVAVGLQLWGPKSRPAYEATECLTRGTRCMQVREGSKNVTFSKRGGIAIPGALTKWACEADAPLHVAFLIAVIASATSFLSSPIRDAKENVNVRDGSQPHSTGYCSHNGFSSLASQISRS